MEQKKHRRIAEICDSELGDEHINLYMKLLNDHFHDRGVLCLETWFLTNLMIKYKRKEIEKKKTSFFNKLIRDGCPFAKRIIIPYHACGNHWILFCIIPETHHIIAIDPLDSREAVITNTCSPVFSEVKIAFQLLISYVFDVCPNKTLKYIFNTSLPWMLCRSYQKKPQNDDISCGFYTLLCARICCATTSFSHLFVFSIDNIENRKKLIAEEIIMEELKPLGDLTVIDSKGVRSTAGLKIWNKLTSSSVKMMIKCIINPIHTAIPSKPRSLIHGVAQPDLVSELMDQLNQCKEGDDFCLALEHIQKDIKNERAIMEMLSIGYETIHECRSIVVRKKFNNMILFISCNMIFRVLRETNTIVSLEETLNENGMEFESDGESSADFIMGLNEMLAGFFHLLVERSSFSMFCIRESVDVRNYIDMNHSYVITTNT